MKMHCDRCDRAETIQNYSLGAIVKPSNSELDLYVIEDCSVDLCAVCYEWYTVNLSRNILPITEVMGENSRSKYVFKED